MTGNVVFYYSFPAFIIECVNSLKKNTKQYDKNMKNIRHCNKREQCKLYTIGINSILIENFFVLHFFQSFIIADVFFPPIAFIL